MWVGSVGFELEFISTTHLGAYPCSHSGWCKETSCILSILPGSTLIPRKAFLVNHGICSSPVTNNLTFTNGTCQSGIFVNGVGRIREWDHSWMG
jgi:hypothetical protein